MCSKVKEKRKVDFSAMVFFYKQRQDFSNSAVKDLHFQGTIFYFWTD